MSAALEPARLAFRAGAPPRALRYDDIYHSAEGGWAQAQHVFLAGNALPQRWRGLPAYTIVETGFGLGLNFLATWQALRADPARPRCLHYVAVEKHPLTPTDLERAHSAWPRLATEARALRSQWPPLIAGFHRIELEHGRVRLTLLLGDAAQLLAELDACADALYLDGFAPEKNPDMWSQPVANELARLSRAGTTLATWTVAGTVRATLMHAGFRVDKRPGFGRKREMLVGVYERKRDMPRRPVVKRAAIIGAGLAGAWCADALTRRDWQVEVIERHSRPAQEASGNAVGALRPALNLADNTNARLARAAFLYATHRLDTDPRLAATFSRCGVLHVATSRELAERMARILAVHEFPHDYVRWVDVREACAIAGRATAGPGWWIPGGGWVNPQALCAALLDPATAGIELRYGRAVAGLRSESGQWRLLDASGDTITVAPIVIFANGHAANELLPEAIAQVVKVRGQVSHLPACARRSLSVVVCGDGYVAPLPTGGLCVGATFAPDETALDLRAADHAQNLARLERMLPGFGAGLDAARLAGRVALRAASADRLPLCGALRLAHDDAGHPPYVVTGLGARGLIWAPLCAEVLAASLDSEPYPLERSLIAAMRAQR